MLTSTAESFRYVPYVVWAARPARALRPLRGQHHRRRAEDRTRHADGGPV